MGENKKFSINAIKVPLDVFLPEKLKLDLESFCQNNQCLMTPTITTSIKEYIVNQHSKPAQITKAPSDIRMNIQIPQVLKAELKKYCEKTGQNIRQVVTDAIKKHILK